MFLRKVILGICWQVFVGFTVSFLTEFLPNELFESNFKVKFIAKKALLLQNFLTRKVDQKLWKNLWFGPLFFWKRDEKVKRIKVYFMKNKSKQLKCQIHEDEPKSRRRKKKQLTVACLRARLTLLKLDLITFGPLPFKVWMTICFNKIKKSINSRFLSDSLKTSV